VEGQEGSGTSREVRLFKGSKTLKGRIPGTLGPEKRFQRVREEKAAKRVNKNPESGTDRARQTLVCGLPFPACVEGRESLRE
jgi:hypothetical protein